MKRWIAILAVWTAVVMLGVGAVPCWGTPLITFTQLTPNTSGYLHAGLTEEYISYFSWTQTVPATNVSIGAMVKGYANGVGTPLEGTAYLTTTIGPGFTAADLIAASLFTAPADAWSNSDLTNAAYTDLFPQWKESNGLPLNLAADTYYVVLQGPIGSGVAGYDPTIYWAGDSYYTLTTLNGFTVPLASQGSTITPAASPPASDFQLSQLGFKFFNVDGTVTGDIIYIERTVPVPASFLLLGSGLVGLVGWRRRRKQ